jgi:molecular chaperone DnaK
MKEMINFGVDLGTTNSLIAKFNKGTVEVFKNPSGFKETLASVVGFRNDRILIGDQARTFAEKDPKSVVSRFKRKMGTTETFKIKALNASKTPVELSAFILKELKNFIHTGEKPEAVVITIPASFDTVQSNATKEAGLAAGFKHVVLLQEPIAASLAYANKEKGVDLKNSQWIVYDLGGGTFDVALVRIIEGELKVVDHEGDNYLGGTDFDSILVEKIIVPELEKRGTFNDLLGQMKSESGKYNRLWTVLLHKAEEAKIELSSKPSSEIDLGLIQVQDDEGKDIDSIISITRSDFESAIKDSVDGTADMLKKILTRNSLSSNDLSFVLMVGGSTYIPFVRKRIEELLNIKINTNIDPTNAIAAGAAYFAAGKEIKITEAAKPTSSKPGAIKIRAVYSRTSQEAEELFSAKVEGDTTGLFYRITRDDGAFDSGLKALAGKIVEELPLQGEAYNLFTFKIVDGQNNEVPVDIGSIQIAQGKYSVAGQMLPEDISLVLDDHGKQDTKLDKIFAKNSILPSKTKKTVEVGKSIIKGSEDEIRIIVVEGSSDNHSSTNKPIGLLVVNGAQVSRDLLKGTEIDLSFEMSESRDLTVSAFLNGTNQEFSQVFEPKPRAVPVKTLSSEILLLEQRLEREVSDAEIDENYELAGELKKLKDTAEVLVGEAILLSQDDVTDERFKLEDKMRRLSQDLHQKTSGKKVAKARAAYLVTKDEVTALIRESGSDRERHQLNEILAKEHAVLSSTSAEKINIATDHLREISAHILSRSPEFLVGFFNHLLERRASMNDQVQADSLIQAGRQHIATEQWESVRQIVGRLFDLLPQKEKDSKEFSGITGLV